MKINLIKEIRKGSYKKRSGYEFVLDELANYVVKLALILKIRASHLTFFWVIFQFLTPLLFLRGTYISFVLAITLFQLMFILDLSDGKLYRFQTFKKPKLKPLFPKFLDKLGHYINNSWLLFWLGVGTFLRFHNWLYLLAGILAALFYLMNKAITLNPAWYLSSEEKEIIAKISLGAGPSTGKSKFNKFIFHFFRLEYLGNILFIGIIFDFPHYLIMVYAVIYFLEVIRKIYLQSKLLMSEDKNRI